MRATLDIDLVLAMDETNLDRFIRVAREYDLQPNIPVPLDALRDVRQIEAWHREKGRLAFSQREPQAGGKVIDILIRPAVPFEQLSQNAVVGELFGKKVLIASIEDLLALKHHANRPRDRLDIEALEKIRQGEDPNV